MAFNLPGEGRNRRILLSPHDNYEAAVGSLLVKQANGKWGPLATPLDVPHGGLGVATLAAHGVLIGEGTSAVAVTGAGTSGQVLTSNGASADPTFQQPFLYTGLTAPPVLSSFSWVNQNGGTAGSTAVQAGGTGTPILMTLVNNAGGLQWKGLFKNQPSTPYTITAWFQTITPASDSYTNGLYFYDGTKLMGIEILRQAVVSSPSYNYPVIRVEKITNVTTDSATSASIPAGWLASGSIGLRLTNNGAGSTIAFSFSFDGYNWVQLFSESIGTFITPTQVGWGGVSIGTLAQQGSQYINLQSWGP